MSYTNGLDDPTLYFSSTIWTGNGVDDRNIVIDGTGMQPDFVWIKSRNDTDNHRLVDSVRGATKHLESDGTGAEQTSSNVKAFTSTGVTLSNNGSVNANSELYTSWSWKAGTSFTNDASSTGIGTIDSTGSVNQDAGFSICSYTGTGSAGTIKHGLNSTPSTIILKNRIDGSVFWYVYHKSLGNNSELYLNGTDAAPGSTGAWNTTSPTSSVFSVGSHGGTNASGQAIIAYCFSEVKSFSKFGSYVGNGSSDGSYIHLGFKPAWVMFKRTDGAYNWVIMDNKRDNFNVATKLLLPNSSSAEIGLPTNLSTDFLSNGFKLRSDSSANPSTNQGNIIYMAFAENPFVSSTGVPATAR